jgi:flagellar motor switch protein FliM
VNPRTIGRPVHLIDKFTTQIRGDLTDGFCEPLNRRYSASFEIAEISLVHSVTPHEPQRRWLNYQTEMGCIGFALAREVLLCILGYRYGTHGKATGLASQESQAADASASAIPPASAIPMEPASAGEERLTTMFGSQLVSLVAARIEAQQPRAADAHSGPSAQITEVSSHVPTEDSWTLRAAITERTRKLQGALWFVLDAACMERLLNSLSLARARAAPQKSAAAVQPLPARLQFTLMARLLEKEIPLGALLDTGVGDVIPFSLRAADVLIGSSRLFTASIAEHRGKLCLTFFEDVE